MDVEQMINMAFDMGFSNAGIINTKNIEFDFGFRKYCEDNVCGQYGKGYSCPPSCGTPMEMKQRTEGYEHTLVLQSSWKIDSLSDKEKINRAKKWHNSQMLRLVKAMRENGYGCLMAGASYCDICSSCKMLVSEPCSFPELSFSCMSAYCINVMSLAAACSMDYRYKDGVLSFFGCVFYKK